MKKLFVGNLPWSTREEDLQAHFEKCGKVLSVKIVTDKETGRSKGFGFVEMESDEAAAAAIEQLKDKPLLDRNLRITVAVNRQDGPGQDDRRRGGAGRGGFRGGRGEYNSGKPSYGSRGR